MKKFWSSFLKLGTGYSAAARTAAGIKESAVRLKSLENLIKPSPQNLQSDGKYTVFSPYVYQYGEKEIVDGKEIFKPEGVVDRLEEVPPGKAFFKGAYFCGDDFAWLIDNVFTEEQRKEMIRGAEINRLIMQVGAISIFIVILMFVVSGYFYALFSLPVVFLLLVYSVKYGIYIETLKAKEIMDFSGYFSRKGFVKGIWGF